MKPRAIEVTIGELVLEGVSPGDRHRVAAALEGELGRLLAERGLPEGLAGGARLDVADGGSFAHGPRATPSSLGAHVAAAVYSGLGRRG
jgi:hypothetical protein